MPEYQPPRSAQRGLRQLSPDLMRCLLSQGKKLRTKQVNYTPLTFKDYWKQRKKRVFFEDLRHYSRIFDFFRHFSTIYDIIQQSKGGNYEIDK